MKIASINFLQACLLAAKRLYVEKHTYQASALSFTTLLLLVPLLSVAISIATTLPISSKFIPILQNFVVHHFLPETIESIDNYFSEFLGHATKLPTLSIIFLFFTSILLIITVVNTLNDIWPSKEINQSLSSRLLYWITLTLTPLYFAVILFFNFYISSSALFTGIEHNTFMRIVSHAALSFLLNTILFSLIYIIVPKQKISWKDSITGGFVAAVLLEFARRGFDFYIEKFSSYDIIYGTFAVIPAFLIWIYVFWIIVLYGMLFVQSKQYRKSKG